MRLIDADALKTSLVESKEQLWKIYNSLENHIYKNIYRGEIEFCAETILRINEAPTIDAVPVVRCMDCKHGEIDDPDFPNQYYCHCGCGWNKDDFYCAYGERKNNENRLY